MFTISQAIDFIEKVFGEGYSSNQGLNHSVVCPFCKRKKGRHYNKKKLAIRTTDFKNHCWVCGYKSQNLYDLLKRFSPEHTEEYRSYFSYQQNISVEQNPKDRNHKVSVPLGFKFLCLSNSNRKYEYKALQYLYNRGLNKDDLWYWKLGITNYKREKLYGRIIFPSFNSYGNLNYYSARTFFSNHRLRYRNPDVDRENIIFNEMNIQWDEPLTITEGPFDVVKCNSNTTCLLGTEFSTDYLLFEKILKNKTPVKLAFDQDAKDKMLKIAQLFYSYNIEVKIVNMHKPNKDMGDMPKNEALDLINKQVVTYTPDYLMESKIREIV